MSEYDVEECYVPEAALLLTSSPKYTTIKSIGAADTLLPDTCQVSVDVLVQLMNEANHSLMNRRNASELTYGACALTIHKAGVSFRSEEGQLMAIKMYTYFGQDIYDVAYSTFSWTKNTKGKIKGGLATAGKIGVVGALAALGIWGG